MYILETIYDDYDITYQTSINENIIPILILLGILGVLIIIFFISMMKIYKKANRSGISAIVPLYNCAVLMEIINEAKWKFLLLIIPGVNIIFFGKAMYQLAKYFRKGEGFCILAAVFPLFMIPMIAFGNSEYIGINEEAMRGVSVAKDIPIETKKPTLSNPDQPLKERTKVNMSIGGGVYQKEYRDSLLEAKNMKEKANLGVTELQEEPESNTDANLNEMNLIQNVAFVEANHNNEPNVQVEVAPSSSALTIELPKIDASQATNEVASFTPPITTPNVVENTNYSFTESTESSGLNIDLGNPMTSSTPSIEISNSPVGIPPAGMSVSPVNNLLTSNNVEATNTVPNLLSQVAPPVANQESKIDLSRSPSIQIEQTVAPASTEEFINCPHCGARIRSGSTKCFMCGNEL